MKKKSLTTLLGVASLALMSATASADGRGGDRSGHERSWPSIRGAWDVISTVRSLPATGEANAVTCAAQPILNPDPAPNPFPALLTFHKGGTLNEQGTRVSSANRGSGHGVWERISGDGFRLKLRFHGFNDAKALSATTTIVMTVALDEDGEHFEASGVLTQDLVPSGQRRFCYTSVGTRMTAD